MTKLALPFFLCFIVSSAFSQTQYELSGNIVGVNNQEPVSFAQVAIYPVGSERPIKGAITDGNGAFSIQVEEGNYDVAVFLIGYEDKRLEGVAINNDKNMGEIGLAVSTQQLKEVVIRGNEVSRPISTNMEGLIIRPDQTISNVGGTVLDVLRNTPSVDVNDDGTISLRGSDGTNILIDGRNSALGTDLSQLPASAIESIQIVNTQIQNTMRNQQGELLTLN